MMLAEGRWYPSRARDRQGRYFQNLLVFAHHHKFVTIHFLITTILPHLDHPMPTFQETDCPLDFPAAIEAIIDDVDEAVDLPAADMCIKVSFPNGNDDVMILTRMHEESTMYDGFLQQDEDVSIIVIDTPQTHHRLVNMQFIRFSCQASKKSNIGNVSY